MQTYAQFIESEQLVMQSQKVNSNPFMNDPKWKANHYQVTIKQEGKGNRYEMNLFYSMGIGLKGKPQLEQVLDSLASDASGYDNARSFEEWASEYGYDEDSRKAEKIYQAISEQVKQLRILLGHSAYQTLLYDMERM